MKQHSIKLPLLCLGLLISVSQAQNFAQTSVTDPAQNKGGITETQITHLTLSDQEQADHWKLSLDEWQDYQKYMAVEGKYFYSHLDPVTTLSIVTKDPKTRLRFIGLSVLKERDRVDAEVNFANDAFRVQRDLFGEEDLFDFNKIPQMDGKYRDKTIMYRDGTSEAEKIEAERNQLSIEAANQSKATTGSMRPIISPVPTSAPTKNQVTAPEDTNQINKTNQTALPLAEMDQIYFVMDAKCQNCQEHIQTLLNQPLQVVLLMKDSTEADLTNFFQKYRLQSFVDKGRVKTRMYQQADLPNGQAAELSDIFMGSNDQILKKISD